MILTPPCCMRLSNRHTMSCVHYGKRPQMMMMTFYQRTFTNCRGPLPNASMVTTVAPWCPALEAAAATSAFEKLPQYSQRCRQLCNLPSLGKVPLLATGIFLWWSIVTHMMGLKSMTLMMNWKMDPLPAMGELRWREQYIGQYPMTFDGFQSICVICHCFICGSHALVLVCLKTKFSCLIFPYFHWLQLNIVISINV